MTMVVSRKQRIFFRYEGERGAFLLLHHDLLGSHEDWYAAGYVEQLAKEFRVVVPDARGHGRSDKPGEKEQYSLLQMAEDLVEILNELGIRNSHFVGYGLGALVGFEMLRRFPERMRIVMAGGESALVTPAVQAVYRAEAESLKAISLGEYLKALRDHGRVVRTVESLNEEVERPAALALLEAMSEWELAPSGRIPVLSPLTLFAGSEDPAAPRVEAARSGMSRARYVSFSGMGHARLFHERASLMEEILRLLKSGRREDGPDGRAREAGGSSSDAGGRMQGKGGDQRHGAAVRREGSRPANRWTDRAASEPATGSSPERPDASAGSILERSESDRAPRPASAGSDLPAPIPGDDLGHRSGTSVPERPVGGEDSAPSESPAASEAGPKEFAMEERAGARSHGLREEPAAPPEPDDEQATPSDALVGRTERNEPAEPDDKPASAKCESPEAQDESDFGATEAAAPDAPPQAHPRDEPPKG